jgi:hypothetical protein
MLGFKTRVAEKGGTSLGSLLSNKDPWSGVACGRVMCRSCAQPEERKEPCMRRNVVYESECGVCNPPGTRREADKRSLAESKGYPSLYVGESARSLAERAQEHWRDAESGKPETHMLEHQEASHGGEGTPSFNFKVVKSCKTSLERQVREAVRIHMRGEVLNKKGMYNRCKLTRMVVDEEWENRVWKESWATKDTVVDEECLERPQSSKRRGESGVAAKRLKREEAGVVWGEDTTGGVGDRQSEFLFEKVTGVDNTLRQSKLKPVTGVEWFCRQILREVTGTVVEIGLDREGVAEWEEWEEEPIHRQWSSKEERSLWKILEELDKADHRAAKLKEKKEKAKVVRARIKMGAGSKQPSIMELLGGRDASKKPVREGEECVNTQTGSVKVAASQSNNVYPVVSRVENNRAGPQPQLAVRAVPHPLQLKENPTVPKANSPAHPISHSQESPETFARIGLCSDEVGPKKLKTGENQQPRPVVGPLLGVVRGEGGSIKANKEGGGCVNTQTGSVKVAASQSNNVNQVNEEVSHMKNSRAMPQPPKLKSKPKAKPKAKNTHSSAHPISHSQESPEAYARIGLCSEEVGPKKLKTGENQQPRPAVGPLLGVMRGGGGVIKTVNEEGGGCVNTQTGSVGLISSQSNIVYGNEDSLKTKYEAVPQPSMDEILNMKKDENAKSTCLDINEEWDKPSMENVSENLSMSEVDAHICNDESMKNVKSVSMSGVQPEGSIEKNMNTSSKPSCQRLRGSGLPDNKANSSSSSNSKLSSTQRLRSYFTTLSSTGRNVGRGDNAKSNSNLTPIKRKLLENKQVPNLVKVINCRVHEGESGESLQTGSPAKRRRLVSRGQTTQQPADN